MEVQPDFKELLELFNAHKVDYLIVGGWALIFHGSPRFTGDLDLWVRPEVDNAARILKALDEFGFGSLGLTIEDFSISDRVVQLGFTPVRVDIMTSLTGVTWNDAQRDRCSGEFGGVPVYFLGKPQFIVNKRAVGRKKDLGDLEALGEE